MTLNTQVNLPNNGLKKAKVNVLERPSQSPELNPKAKSWKGQTAESSCEEIHQDSRP